MMKNLSFNYVVATIIVILLGFILLTSTLDMYYHYIGLKMQVCLAQINGGNEQLEIYKCIHK